MTIRTATHYPISQRRAYMTARINRMYTMLTHINMRLPPFAGLSRSASEFRMEARRTVILAIRRWEKHLRELDS